jgi:hypothetical protein
LAARIGPAAGALSQTRFGVTILLAFGSACSRLVNITRTRIDERGAMCEMLR